MSHEPLHFVVTDPRGFDGNPFEVSARASKQAESVARILSQCVETALIMGRNADMSRREEATGDPEAKQWEDSVYGRKFARLHQQAKEIERELSKLGPAVSYDPKHPPKA